MQNVNSMLSKGKKLERSRLATGNEQFLKYDSKKKVTQKLTEVEVVHDVRHQYVLQHGQVRIFVSAKEFH